VTDDAASLIAAARSGSRRALARLLTAAEKGADLPDFPVPARRAHVVGLTGAPGVGKSTTTAALTRALRAAGRRVAILAIDPSSPFTGGALLGDRIRMSDHAADPEVYIRSMAARGRLGGLAAAVPAAIRILEAVGFDVILVETVGVGQSEIDIASAADTTVVLLAPGMGDGIQATKAGLLEIADVLVVNKADRPGADAAVRDLRSALRLAAREPGAWRVPVQAVSAAAGTGVDALVAALEDHLQHATASGALERRRVQRWRAEVEATVLGELRDRAAPLVAAALWEAARGGEAPHTVARAIVNRLLSQHNRPGE